MYWHITCEYRLIFQDAQDAVHLHQEQKLYQILEYQIVELV